MVLRYQHTAEVIHQIEGDRVVAVGWVGGDAWFGSTVTVIEAKKRLNIESTWSIKGNHSFYPMVALHMVMKARFGTKTDGHWVSMTIHIDGPPVLALAYVWSKSFRRVVILQYHQFHTEVHLRMTSVMLITN
jgi:hypothetical protein